MSSLADDLAGLADLTPVQLRARWQALEDAPTPRVAPALLRRLLAQRLQERRFGGLPAAVRRELQRIASDLPAETIKPKRKPLTVGTRLVREWNGKTITVEVSDNGFV